MNDSFNRSLRFAALGFVLLTAMPIFGAGAAGAPMQIAQSEAPVKLAPPKSVLPVEPQKEQPAVTTTQTLPTIEPEAGQQTTATEVQVEVNQLESVDPDAAGLLDETGGGFRLDLWADTRRELVEDLVPMLPVRMSSEAMRGLTRRLLLSSAQPPEGTGAQRSLLALRAERLAAMGDIAAVQALLSNASVQQEDESVVRLQVETLFLAYDNAGACDQVRDQIKRSQGVYWQKALIFCQALSGQHASAQLGLDLLREQGQQEDAGFFAMVDALAGVPEVVVESLPDPVALDLAMMRAGRQQLPEDVLSSTEPAILRTVAVSPNAAIDLRLEAAERAHAIGALSATALSQLYESVPFTEDELTNALSIAADDYGPRARALLYRAAQLQAVPTARAEVLQRTWELSRQAGDFHTVVKVNLPLLMELAPSAELTWFAGGAARSLYAAGSAAEAWRWFDLARRHAPVNAEAAAAAVALWPLSYLADPDGEPGWDEALLAAWWSQTRAKSTEAELRATLLYGLFAALGRNIDGVHWQPMLEIPSSNDGRLPAPALWHGLRTAAEAGRVGETVLYALIMLGDDGPAGSHPIVLYHVLANLRLAGLEGDARALALEAAIGAGL